MFDYNIYTDNSPEEFKNACEKVKNAFPDYEKHKLLVDVDGSTIQIFSKSGKKIKIYDDYDVGAVYAVSDVELKNVL